MEDDMFMKHAIEEEKRLASIENDIKQIQETVSELKIAVDGLVTAWNAAGFLIATIKYSAGFVTAIGILYAYFKGN